VPLDPTGRPFVLEPSPGVVTLSPDSSLNPLPGGERTSGSPR